MSKTPILLTLGLVLASLSGCVEDGPGYVESRVINEGRVGGPVYAGGPVYRSAPAYRGVPVEGTRILGPSDRYSGGGVYRDPGYGDPYAGDRRYSNGRGGDYDRYERRGGDRFDRRRYCASVGYDDPRCD